MKLGRKPPSADADLLKAEKELTAANRELAWELSKVAVDVAGFVDPTPISDAVSMGMSLIDGDFVGAGLSLVSMVPYAGDALAKTTKGARAAKKILKLQKKIAALAAKVRALKAAKASKGVSKAASKTISKAAKKPPSNGVCVECAKRAKIKPKRGSAIRRGDKHPRVKAAAKIGRQKHSEFAARLRARGQHAEVTLPSGKRMDGLIVDPKRKTAIIVELKPDNMRAKALGEKQLRNYKKELEKLPNFKLKGLEPQDFRQYRIRTRIETY
jgi:hypothetical protein